MHSENHKAKAFFRRIPHTRVVQERPCSVVASSPFGGALPWERLPDWADLQGLGLRSPVLRSEDQHNTGKRNTQPCKVGPVSGPLPTACAARRAWALLASLGLLRPSSASSFDLLWLRSFRNKKQKPLRDLNPKPPKKMFGWSVSGGGLIVRGRAARALLGFYGEAPTPP